MMRSVYQAANPDDMEMTMTVTMTVSEWRGVSQQLNNAHPGWNYARHINKLVSTAVQVFASSDGTEAGEE